jgi:hypothetical protein
MATMPNPYVHVCVSVSRVPTGMMGGCARRKAPGRGWLRRCPPFVLLHGVCVCFMTAGPITKLFAWGEEESGGHVL